MSNYRVDPGPFPRRVTVELSSRCNLTCRMCPRRYLDQTDGFMAVDLFKRIVDQISAHPVEAVVPFFRGEALLHPQFLELIHYLRAHTPARIQLATNALLLDEAPARELLDLEIDFISFSLDAVKPETYAKIRIGGNFTRVMRNVHRFLELRQILSRSKTTVQVSATRSDHNREEIAAFIDYWKPRVDRVRIYPEHSGGGRFGRLTDPANQRRTPRCPCKKLYTDMVIYSDGRVGICNHDWQRPDDNPIGSATDREISALWQGDAYRRLRRLHQDGRWQEVVPCGHCDHWQAVTEAQSPIGDRIQ